MKNGQKCNERSQVMEPLLMIGYKDPSAIPTLSLLTMKYRFQIIMRSLLHVLKLLNP